MGIELFVIVAAFIVIILDYIRRQDQLPVGSIWFASTFIYGGLGIILGMQALGRQLGIDASALVVDQLALRVFTITLIGFVAGYCGIKKFLSCAHLGEIRIALLIKHSSEFNYYNLLL
jgi:hypothetical protein